MVGRQVGKAGGRRQGGEERKKFWEAESGRRRRRNAITITGSPPKEQGRVYKKVNSRQEAGKGVQPITMLHSPCGRGRNGHGDMYKGKGTRQGRRRKKTQGSTVGSWVRVVGRQCVKGTTPWESEKVNVA